MEILCELIIGFKDGKPKINITWRESSHPMTLQIDEARNLALNILECTEAAIHDTFMWDWAMDNLPGPTHKEKQAQAATLVNLFRQYREEKQHERGR